MSATVPMMDVYVPMMKVSAMTSAAELGVFHHLSKGPSTAEQTARACGASTRGMETLLTALAAMGVLEQGALGFTNSAHVEKYFTPNSAVDFTPGLLWTAEAWRLMGDLTQAVRDGKPRTILWEDMQKRPALGDLFAQYMKAFAAYLQPFFINAVEVPAHATRLLDVGGSHGLHSIGFCQKNPLLSAVVFDLKDSTRATPDIIAQHGLQDRIRVQHGDANRDPLGGPYDVVLLLSVLHNQTLDQSQELLGSAARALNAGGMVVIFDHFVGPVGLYPALLDLTLLVETGTRTAPRPRLNGWLAHHGLTTTHQIDLPEPGWGTLVVATKD